MASWKVPWRSNCKTSIRGLRQITWQRVQLDPAPPGWRELTGRLRQAPNSPIAKALSSPLALTLIRDTYRGGDDVRELLNFCDAASQGVSREDIEDHLLDRVLPAAYSPRPGKHRPGMTFRQLSMPCATSLRA